MTQQSQPKPDPQIPNLTPSVEAYALALTALLAQANLTAQALADARLVPKPPNPDGRPRNAYPHFYLREFLDGRIGLWDTQAQAPFNNPACLITPEMALGLCEALKAGVTPGQVYKSSDILAARGKDT